MCKVKRGCQGRPCKVWNVGFSAACVGRLKHWNHFTVLSFCLWVCPLHCNVLACLRRWHMCFMDILMFYHPYKASSQFICLKFSNTLRVLKAVHRYDWSYYITEHTIFPQQRLEKHLDNYCFTTPLLCFIFHYSWDFCILQTLVFATGTHYKNIFFFFVR